jgi:hypothetical protein
MQYIIINNGGLPCPSLLENFLGGFLVVVVVVVMVVVVVSVAVTDSFHSKLGLSFSCSR